MKAIILDDDPIILTLLENVLKKRRYEVLRYTCPPHCPVYQYEKCDCFLEKNLCADVIITDLDMPFVKGTEFIERLRAIGCKCNNIAMMSGSWTPKNLKHATSLAIKILQKPFEIKSLVKWLEDVEKNSIKLPEISVSSPTDQLEEYLPDGDYPPLGGDSPSIK